jgi:hypothetical protein
MPPRPPRPPRSPPLPGRFDHPADGRSRMADRLWAMGLERLGSSETAGVLLMDAGEETMVSLGALPLRLVPTSNPRRFAVSPPRAGGPGGARGARGARRRDPTRGPKCPRQTHAKEGGGRRGAGGPAVRQSGGQAVRRSGGQEVRRSGGQEVRRSGGQAVRQSGGQEVRRSGGPGQRRASPVVNALDVVVLGSTVQNVVPLSKLGEMDDQSLSRRVDESISHNWSGSGCMNMLTLASPNDVASHN